MEALLVVIVIGLPIAAVTGFVVAVVALNRTQTLRRRIDAVEHRMLDLEVRPGQAAETVGVPAPAPPVAPLATAAGVAVPAPTPAPTTVAEPPPEPAPVAAAPPTAAPPPAAAAPPAAHAAPPEPVAPPPPPIPGGPRRPPSSPTIKIDWERWIGVRGAAAAGGVVLALAALLFFQYSIEHGLISPTMRVVLGVLVGLGCLVGSEYLVRRNQPAAANALTGAGVVILYGATWAAQNLYHLINAVPAFVLMVAVTAVCVTVSIARNARFIAVLGLVGGFATPILVASDVNSPAALFGYILLLDLGLLWLAKARAWPLLAILCLVGTALHQGLWILGSMNADRAALGLVILGVFGLAFLLVGNGEKDTSRLWRATKAGGVAIPFAFGLHYAGSARLADNPIPLGILLVILSIGAGWLGRRLLRGAAVGAAAASLGVMTLWVITHTLDVSRAWQAVAVCLAVSAVWVVAAALHLDHPRRRSFLAAALIAEVGFIGVLVIAAGAWSVHRPWPWLIGWLFLGAAEAWSARQTSKHWLQLAAGLGPALGLTVLAIAHGHHVDGFEPWLWCAVIAALPIAVQILAVVRPDHPARPWTERTAIATALALMPAAAILADQNRPEAALFLGLILVLGALATLAATRLRSGWWYLATVAATAPWQTLIFMDLYVDRLEPVAAFPPAYALLVATVVFYLAWPLLAWRAFAGRRQAWWASALTGPLWFLPLKAGFVAQWGSDAIAILPIGLAVLTLAAVARIRPALAGDDRTRFSAVVWYSAAALCLVSVAIPLQLDREWITIGWALNGLAVLALWSRLDHPGLKYFGLALLGAATVRLVVNPSVLGYHMRSVSPLVNWLAYTYLVPAVAMVLSMRLLGPREGPRLRPWEERVYPGGRPLGAPACGLGAVAIVFVWINLVIANYFATGNNLQLTLERLPARDATTSVAWAIYALVLLAIGVRGRSSSLRWLSLGLLVATILKVFLHDLGKLEDLYRVASLAGLAVSLIVVSLIYQKFVFAVPGGEKT